MKNFAYNVYMREFMIIGLAIFTILLVVAMVLRFGNPATKKVVELWIGDPATPGEYGHRFEVEVAKTEAARARGLSGRDSLPENHGMLFVFMIPGNYGFWMKDMKFALDLIWIRGDEVVGVTENVSPEPEKGMFTLPSYYPPKAVNKVLEVNAGTISRLGIKIGDMVRINL